VFHAFLTGFALTLGFTTGLPSNPAHHDSLHLRALAGWVQEASPDTAPTRWVLSSQGSEARYRVREQLAGFDFPNDAVGASGEITGTLVLGPEGAIVSRGSEFRVRLVSLTTDNERRDGYVRQRILEVEEFPEAVLVPRRFVNLPHPLSESGPVTFLLEADLTLHGQTHASVWDVTAEFGPDGIVGLATTAFQFDTFGIALPKVARVLSVDDNIRLELEFRMVPEGG
jgi:polyisoprenoid-binding protein YceI